MTAQPRLPSCGEVAQMLAQGFPHDADALTIEAVGRDTRLRFHPRPRHLRPGGMVHGGALTALADLTSFVAVVSTMPGTDAVTTDITIHFVGRAGHDEEFLSSARFIREGTICLLDCTIRTASTEAIVAHAIVTYRLLEPRVPLDSR